MSVSNYYYTCAAQLKRSAASRSGQSQACRRAKNQRYKYSYSTHASSNPLERLEELGTRRFGALFEFEGVLVSCSRKSEQEDWVKLASEHHLKTPSDYELRVAYRRKSDFAISQIFHWELDSQRVKYLSEQKSLLLYEKVLKTTSLRETVRSFLQLLHKFGIPCAVYSSQFTTSQLSDLLHLLQVAEYFLPRPNTAHSESLIIGCDYLQNGLPDTEIFTTLANKLSRSISKCVVLSDNHLAIEATSELGMKCVIVATTESVWELQHADMVVTSLSCISFRNLQNLFRLEVNERS